MRFKTNQSFVYKLVRHCDFHNMSAIAPADTSAPSRWNQIRRSWYRTRCIYMYLLFMFIKVNTCKVANFFTPAKFVNSESETYFKQCLLYICYNYLINCHLHSMFLLFFLPLSPNKNASKGLRQHPSDQHFVALSSQELVHFWVVKSSL